MTRATYPTQISDHYAHIIPAIQTMGRHLATRRRHGTKHFNLSLEPGDGTRYNVFGTIDPADEEGTILFALEGSGAYRFQLDAFHHVGYLMEKLGIENVHTAAVMAELLHAIGEPLATVGRTTAQMP